MCIGNISFGICYSLLRILPRIFEVHICYIYFTYTFSIYVCKRIMESYGSLDLVNQGEQWQSSLAVVKDNLMTLVNPSDFLVLCVNEMWLHITLSKDFEPKTSPLEFIHF